MEIQKNELIRQAREEDYPAIRKLLKDAFLREDSDPVLNEWELVERLRQVEEFLPEFSLVAESASGLTGYVLFTPVRIEGRRGLALAPLATAVGSRKQGVADRLVREGLLRAADAKYPWVVVLGGDYYLRFGFRNAESKITLAPDHPANSHLKVLPLPAGNGILPAGEVRFTSPFYDKQGNLL